MVKMGDMFVPRKLSVWLERILPGFLKKPLHRTYGAYLDWMVPRINKQILRRLFPSGDLRVLSGPFQGMKYLPFSSGSALLPKLLGTYEQELHGVFDQVLRRQYRAIIDIGCAEGYYVVGLALKMPNAAVYGFDLDPGAQDKCRQLARLNGIENRVTLLGRCSVESLIPLVGPGSLIICDCEGAEMELLDPEKAGGLRHADILVELHDQLVPGITSVIRQRFSPTGKVALLQSTERDLSACPESLAPLSRREQKLALNELRGHSPIGWAFIEAKAEPSNRTADSPGGRG
jgi:hypothetical protein